MQRNIFYYVKLNGKKSTAVHIVQKTCGGLLPSSRDTALCGYEDIKRLDRHPVPNSETYVRGWEFISNQLPTDRKVRICKSCLRIMNKHMNEMF